MSNSKPFDSLIKLFDMPKLKTNTSNNPSRNMHQTSNSIETSNFNVGSEIITSTTEPTLQRLVADEKKKKWNAYMRQYNAKKKQEREDRLNKVALTINNCEKLYDVKEINQILINNIVILIEICNNNIQGLEKTAINNKLLNSMNDIKEYSLILQEAVKSII